MMFTSTALLGSLPPASLAATDLSRFLSRAVGRLALRELPGLRALLAEEPLAGYPVTLAPAMIAFLEVLEARGVEPSDLDPPGVDAILASSAWIEAVGRRARLDRATLRPGLAVGEEVRDQLAGRLERLPGEGAQLVLVAPVRLLELAGLGWSALLTPALARPMGAEEAARLRDAWAILEERVAWPSASAEVWVARFVELASRRSHDAAGCVAALAGADATRRRALWSALIEHLRDQELPDAHRPGPRGLVTRLAVLPGGVPDEALLATLVPIARAAYEACTLDPRVARGYCPCVEADLEAYGSWVDVAPRARQVVADLGPWRVAHRLRALAARDAGILQVVDGDDVERALRAFRDQYLRLRYRRDTLPLVGVDPLVLAESLIREGLDRARIAEALEQLLEEADRSAAERRADDAALEATASAADHPPETDEDEAPPPAPPARQEPAAVHGASPPKVHTPSSEAIAPSPFDGVEPPAGPKRPPSGLNPFRGAGDRPPTLRLKKGEPVPVPDDLPPMPKPPPRKRAVTRSRSELPPMPDAGWVPPSPRPPGSRDRTRRVVPPAPSAQPAAPPTAARPAGPGVRPASARPPTRPVGPTLRSNGQRPGGAPHLVTPGQAATFYESAFRELQILERDLLERGPWQAAARRVQDLAGQADELVAALGPPARSGDPSFQSALHKVELVRAYLERVRPLLEGEPPGEPTPAPDPGVLSRIGKLWRRDRG